MRVQFVSQHFHPVLGGIETRLREFATRLAARGHEVTVHCSRRAPGGSILEPVQAMEGYDVRRWKPWFDDGGYRSLFAAKVDPGGLLDLNGYPCLSVDWLMKRSSGHALVRTPVGAPLPTATRTQAAMLRAYDRTLGVPSLRAAHRVVVMTRNETDWMTARGIPAQRILEVANGVSDDNFQPTDPPRAEWGRYFLFLGRLFWEKGPVDIVEALGRAGADLHGFHAVFAGPDQGEAARVRQRAQQLGVADRVHVLGPVSDQLKRQLLGGCEALVLPSKWEAQGIVVQEAWAHGKPTIVAAVGGVPYLVGDGTDSLLVPWSDPDRLAAAMVRIAQDDAGRRAMGAAARSKAWERYRWDPLVDRLEAVYAAAAAEAGIH